MMNKNKLYNQSLGYLDDKGMALSSCIMNIPSKPGTYAITMQLAKFAVITVGKLGTFKFEPGYYTYVGTAFGPGGLKARIGRHLKKDKKLKWHIDYLREYMEITDVRFAETANNEECLWAAKLANNDGTCPIKGFGSSDCKCFSHLIYFDKIPQLLGQSKKSISVNDMNALIKTGIAESNKA